MKIISRRLKSKIIFEVSTTKIDRLLPTIDEILNCHYLILESLKNIKLK